jgi:hypothetical protein
MCVFCWNLMKDYVSESMISMCVFSWDFMKDYELELMIAMCVCVHAKIM